VRPGNFHAAGAPNKLPDQKPVVDKQGKVLHDGKTWSFQKCLRSLRKHHAAEIATRRRDR
jgi:hypothetical protein